LNVRQIKQINPHPAESDEDGSPESMLDTENCLDWDRDLDNTIDSEVNREVDNDSNLELDIGVKDSVTPEQ